MKAFIIAMVLPVLFGVALLLIAGLIDAKEREYTKIKCHEKDLQLLELKRDYLCTTKNGFIIAP